jgi:hypothetical protein
MFRRTVLAFSLFAASVGAVSFSASQASAANVGTGACVSTIDDATGVSTTVASDGACVVTFATASASPTTSTQYATRSWTVPAGVASVDVLVVAGGGGGGSSNGCCYDAGAGGGGGVVVATGFAVTPGASVTVLTGQGGRGTYCGNGYDGGRSQFSTLLAIGGGRGGGCSVSVGSGGSGGGAHCYSSRGSSTQATAGTASNGTNITAYGSAGGLSTDCSQGGGGGGGGATQVGAAGTGAGSSGPSGGVGGAGGEGISNSLRTESPIVYGSGGGGQGRWTNGLGGTNAGDGSGTNAAGGTGIDGVDETGGGGGAGWRAGVVGAAAGDGGSGVVVVRYFADSTPSNSSSPSISGTTTNGQTLTGSRGTWSGYPTPTYSYQWKRASSASGTYSNISNATSLTYTLTDNDIDQFLKFAVTATNTAGSTTELSNATAKIADMFRPTTTTTTTTTLPTVNIVVSAPVTTVAVGQASIATVVSTSSTVPKVAQTTAIATAPTTTTTNPVVQTTVPKAPQPAAVNTGEAVVSVAGEKTPATLARENNQIVITAGNVTATLGSVDSSGNNVALDADGNLRLAPGQKLNITLNGFESGSIVDAWLFSTPYHLGSTKVGTDGVAKAQFVLRKDVPAGAHRISLLARMSDGKPAQLTLGIAVGSYKKEVNMALWMIITPVVLAVGLALFLPAAYRRRKNSSLV